MHVYLISTACIFMHLVYGPGKEECVGYPAYVKTSHMQKNKILNHYISFLIERDYLKEYVSHVT